MVVMVTEEEGIVDVTADTQVIDAMVIAGAPTEEELTDGVITNG